MKMKIGGLLEIKREMKDIILLMFLREIKMKILFRFEKEMKDIMENRRFYVSECIDEPPSIIPPGVSKRFNSPRPFPDDFPHTS